MADWIATFIGNIGYFGVAFLMFFENIFPPIPSELVMPFAGFDAARSPNTLLGMIIAGTLGSVVGNLIWYWVGRKFKARRLKALAEQHGRWITVTPSEVDRAIAWFERHGPVAVFLARLIPGLRTFISIPAGLSRMPMTSFLAYTTLGTLLWSAILAGAGYMLGSQYAAVSHILDPIATAIVIALVGAYIYRVLTFSRRSRAEAPANQKATEAP